MKVKLRKCPALIGRKEAAGLLGVAPENIYRIAEVPPPLQHRGIVGFEVSTGPLWVRSEIEELVTRRLAVKAAAAKRELARSGK